MVAVPTLDLETVLGSVLVPACAIGLEKKMSYVGLGAVSSPRTLFK